MEYRALQLVRLYVAVEFAILHALAQRNDILTSLGRLGD